MENLIRRILKEYVSELNELDTSGVHFNQQFKERVLNPKYYDVITTSRRRIGTYIMPIEDKNKIIQSFNFLGEDRVKIDPNLNLAIIIHRFHIRLNDIIFDDPLEKNKIIGKIINKEMPIYLSTPEKDSTVGHTLVCVVRGGEVKTTFFVKHYTKEDWYHMFFDCIILDDPRDIEKYIIPPPGKDKSSYLNRVYQKPKKHK